MTVYLLHFSEPIAHARHYVGFTEKNLDRRLHQHRVGRGARLTQVAYERCISFIVARVWEGADRTFERQLKNQKQAPRLCPICNPVGSSRRMIT